MHAFRFRLFQFRSPLLSESFVYFLFVLLLRCFSSQAFLRTDYWFICGFLSFNLKGFPHSDSFGSRLFSSSPKLIAALHVLRRLSMPRHPPLALCSFTYLYMSSFDLYTLVSLMITLYHFLLSFNNSYLLLQPDCSCGVFFQKLLRRYRSAPPCSSCSRKTTPARTGCRFWYTLIILCNFQCTTSNFLFGRW